MNSIFLVIFLSNKIFLFRFPLSHLSRTVPFFHRKISLSKHSKYSNELLLVVKKTKFQLEKKQQATYPSILIMNFEMKKSHCPAPMRRDRIVIFFSISFTLVPGVCRFFDCSNVSFLP